MFLTTGIGTKTVIIKQIYCHPNNMTTIMTTFMGIWQVIDTIREGNPLYKHCKQLIISVYL